MEEKEPKHRDDKKGKYRHEVYVGKKKILTNYSFDTIEEGKEWVNWNNFGAGFYGEIVENPDFSNK